MPGLWPSLMPCVLRMFKIPILMSSPLPPPLGSVAIANLKRWRESRSISESETQAQTPSANALCREAMSFPW